MTERIVVLSDGANLTHPIWKSTARELWKAPGRLYECIGEEGDLIADWFIRLNKEINATFLHVNTP